MIFTGQEARDKIAQGFKPNIASPNQGCTLTFANHSKKTIVMNWVNGTDLVPYGTPSPNQQIPQPTYTGHLWAVQTQDDGVVHILLCQVKG
jgi:hypothetical protein